MNSEKENRELKNNDLEKVSGGYGIFSQRTFFVDLSMCVGCGACENRCPTGSIHLCGDHAEIDQGMCIQCGACVDVCPMGAIHKQG